MAEPSWPSGLIDSDILIDAGRGLPAAVDFVSELRNDGDLSVSAITAMELLVGCANKTELRIIERFLKTLTILPVDEAASDQALDWIRMFRLSHGLQIPDALIAATAIQNDLTLFTKNVRHFQMLPDLRIFRPY